jgi:peptide chain release factor 2
MRDFSDELGLLAKRVGEAEAYLTIEAGRQRVAELDAEVSQPDLWDDAAQARRVTTELEHLRRDIELYDRLVGDLEDARTLDQLAREEDDASVEAEVAAAVEDLGRRLDELELRSLFGGEHDERDAICEVHAGEGGTDAQDWAEMLVLMYQRWAERRGLTSEVDEASPGKEAGLMSPFDAASRRQTSFASVDVTPFLEDTSSEVDIDEKDLRIDTYRSSGAGGQHVNVTDSAVRITHLPTGLITSCQNQRSQHQNKARAMQILGAKLAEHQRAEHQRELEAISGSSSQAAMGNQIRSYVLHPYQLVKDLRTGEETGNVAAVLNGDLDDFMEAYLRWERGAGAEA